MSDVSWTALLPPALAIGCALLTRQVLPSLFAGIWLAYGLLAFGADRSLNPLSALADAVDGILRVFESPGDTRVLIFMMLIGSMMALIERNGGVGGLIRALSKLRFSQSPKGAQWLAWGTGVVIFIESTVTLLVAGAVARPLFDRFRLSRERLAYLIDSTSAPVCILIPLNAWGAINLGLLENTGLEDPLGVFVSAIPLNIYAFSAVAFAAATIAFGWRFGPMGAADDRAAQGAAAAPLASEGEEGASQGHAGHMLLPLLALLLTVPLGLWITGNGDFMAGSGSKAVLWGVLAGLTVTALQAARQGTAFADIMETSLAGAANLLTISVILLFALALGTAAKALGTGPYLAQLVGDQVPAFLLPALVFLVSGITAFSIGSSFGTFALMIPLAIPLALDLGLPPSLLLATVLGGAVFGDHASPISDTTVVASLAAEASHIEHVRTQLPFALCAGAIALVAYLGLGVLYTA
jgi:tetracycline resistance efflux pump